MKQKIRCGVFETNSSSVHTISIYNHLAILSEEEYQKYLNDEIIVSEYGDIRDVEEVRQKALETWKNCQKNEYPKSVYGSDRAGFIEHELYSGNVKELKDFDDYDINHGTRVVNGETIHVISISRGEEREEFRG